MTRAYRLGNPLVTANLQYSGIVFSSILGMLVWQDKLTSISWFGIAVITLSGVMATYFHSRSQHSLRIATDT
jgi:S-adenosylmethionine uptake transporter